MFITEFRGVFIDALASGCVKCNLLLQTAQFYLFIGLIDFCVVCDNLNQGCQTHGLQRPDFGGETMDSGLSYAKFHGKEI
jgi:hypothetical protein